ncbi:hypothetical protein [Brachyspira pilosicoli]|uniref:hypothetical protein n=1 Tax=Brachyspira pilosicoli TaxID=52584 RepID=UPI001CA4B7AD|nr:hypothetical protein [Brachyspira pilosicoli]MBW5391669.1 hypothetical protein [Brachyspira pilosicoli]
MNKKLLTIFSLLLIFFAMSCNKKPTDPTAPLKDSQYVGKWYQEGIDANPVYEIKQDGSIDAIENGAVVATVNGTDVVKEGDATFKATFSANGITDEVTFTFTDDKTGTVKSSGQEASTFNIVKK